MSERPCRRLCQRVDHPGDAAHEGRRGEGDCGGRGRTPLKSNATRDWRVGGWRVKSVREAGWAGPARSWWRDQVVKGQPLVAHRNRGRARARRDRDVCPGRVEKGGCGTGRRAECRGSR